MSDETKAPPCPWCAHSGAPLDEAHQLVSRVERPRGCGGQTVMPWDRGGWSCRGCGVTAPEEAWARALVWAAAELGLADAERDEAIRRALP